MLLSLLFSANALAANVLTLEASQFDAAQQATLLATGCTNGDKVYFAVSTKGLGNGGCPPALQTCIDIKSPKVLGSKICANNQASLAFNVPQNFAPGTFVAAQAISIGVKSDPTVRWVDQYWHEIMVDGDLSDWYGNDELFDTTSGANENGLTWDGDTLYIGSRHPDVQYGGAQHWLTIFLGDGVDGGLTGPQIGFQQPGLPTPFQYQLRWKPDGSYDSLMTWDANTMTWVSTDFWLGTSGTMVAENDQLQNVEIAIPFVALGLGDYVVAHIAWVYEGAGFETTYSGSPMTSFVDGYDPDLTDFLVIDRTMTASPVVQNP